MLVMFTKNEHYCWNNGDDLSTHMFSLLLPSPLILQRIDADKHENFTFFFRSTKKKIVTSLKRNFNMLVICRFWFELVKIVVFLLFAISVSGVCEKKKKRKSIHSEFLSLFVYRTRLEYSRSYVEMYERNVIKCTIHTFLLINAFESRHQVNQPNNRTFVVFWSEKKEDRTGIKSMFCILMFYYVLAIFNYPT